MASLMALPIELRHQIIKDVLTIDPIENDHDERRNDWYPLLFINRTFHHDVVSMLAYATLSIKIPSASVLLAARCVEEYIRCPNVPSLPAARQAFEYFSRFSSVSVVLCVGAKGSGRMHDANLSYAPLGRILEGKIQESSGSGRQGSTSVTLIKERHPICCYNPVVGLSARSAPPQCSKVDMAQKYESPCDYLPWLGRPCSEDGRPVGLFRLLDAMLGFESARRKLLRDLDPGERWWCTQCGDSMFVGGWTLDGTKVVNKDRVFYREDSVRDQLLKDSDDVVFWCDENTPSMHGW